VQGHEKESEAKIGKHRSIYTLLSSVALFLMRMSPGVKALPPPPLKTRLHAAAGHKTIKRHSRPL